MIRIALGPLWVRVPVFLALAALWAAFFTATQWFQDGSVPSTVIPVLVITISALAVWSAVAVSQVRQRYGRILDNVHSPVARRQALRSAFHGPIPAEPVVRNIAAMIAAIRVRTLARQTRRHTITNGVMAALCACWTIYFLTNGTTREALAFGSFLLIFSLSAVSTPWAHRRVARRYMLLAGDPLPPSTPIVHFLRATMARRG